MEEAEEAVVFCNPARSMVSQRYRRCREAIHTVWPCSVLLNATRSRAVAGIDERINLDGESSWGGRQSWERVWSVGELAGAVSGPAAVLKRERER